jgi:transcription initiation factor TFIID subunit 11
MGEHDAGGSSLKRRLSELSDAGAGAGSRPGVPSGKKKSRRESEHELAAAAASDGAHDSEDELKPRYGDNEEDRQRLSALLSTFSKEQMHRYESFRRSHLDRRKVKALVKEVSGAKVSDELAVAMGGIAKIFAGELIELAREDMGDFTGPIHPLHIRNAYRKLRLQGKLPYLATPARPLVG